MDTQEVCSLDSLDWKRRDGKHFWDYSLIPVGDNTLYLERNTNSSVIFCFILIQGRIPNFSGKIQEQVQSHLFSWLWVKTVYDVLSAQCILLEVLNGTDEGGRNVAK